jgi:diadenosine tetraphosphate (Ap4A) HIT family hydrolase
MTSSNPESYSCATCDFALWNPVCQLDVSFLGVYNDARFPGRSILVLNKHIEHWEDVPSSLLNAYVADSQRAMKAISKLTGTPRVNLAVLGNTDSHVHFHLIPRYPHSEALPNKSPWNDPRPQTKMSSIAVAELVADLARELA